jgi:L-phenylalanine/L-methionine N-acetyltransferase
MEPETITIRRPRSTDAAAYARIMDDPKVLPNLLQVPYTSAEIWTQRLADSNAPGKTDLFLVAELGGEVVANAGLHPAGNFGRRRHCMGLGIAVASSAQGRGVGRALMKAMCEWADDWGQVLRIELHVFTDNERAIRLYEGFGFVREGTHRGYALRAGRFADCYSMARLHPNPPAIR